MGLFSFSGHLYLQNMNMNYGFLQSLTPWRRLHTDTHSLCHCTAAAQPLLLFSVAGSEHADRLITTDEPEGKRRCHISGHFFCRCGFQKYCCQFGSLHYMDMNSGVPIASMATGV